jgi:hypothetical protein
VGTANRGRPGLGQADVADLALGDQLGQRADGILDRGFRIDAVLIVEIDVVGAKPRPSSITGAGRERRRRRSGKGS